jgi:lysophospholipase L1-like esterase
MTTGGRCRYLAGSQLAEAEAFILSHPGRIATVTVNIGDNDVENCMVGGAVDEACLRKGFSAVHSRVPAIAAGLRAAAGRKVPIAGLVDYDQFLAYWLRGGSGRAFALRSAQLVQRLNATAGRAYHAAGVGVGDAGATFATADLQDQAPLPGYGPVPLAVQRVCLWTWACSPPPIGFNDHANATGYRVLARALLGALATAVPSIS